MVITAAKDIIQDLVFCNLRPTMQETWSQHSQTVLATFWPTVGRVVTVKVYLVE